MKKLIIYLVIGVSLIIIIWVVFCLLSPVVVKSFSPTNNDREAPTDTAIEIVFSRSIWLNNFTILLDGKTPQYSVNKKDKKLFFTFKDALNPDTTYHIILNAKKPFVYLNQKTNSIDWQFTTSTGTFEEINDMNFGDFFEKNPLARSTPFENDHFRIDWPDDEGFTPITLFATFNAGVNGPPIKEQEKAYHEELKTYRNEALEYIKSKGVDPNSLEIQWIPEEAKDY